MRICITCDGISNESADSVVQNPSELQCDYCGTPLLATTEVHFPVRRGETEAGHPMIGQLIGGKYRVQGVLGKGGMGTVFRAVHEVSLVPVAIKLLHRRFASRPDYREWFLAEARKAGQVIHEHSARVQDVGETEDGNVFLVMELATGLPLSAWLQDGATLRAGVVVEILTQIVRALEVAHTVGVVHRDLSPRNIAISVRDQLPFVKILDFGIATGAADSALHKGRVGSERVVVDAAATKSGARATNDAGDVATGAPPGFANPAYSAPEHLRGSDDVDGRADLYSLGVIAYRALCGSLPVRGKTPAEVAAATREGALEPFRPPAGVSSRLARLVQRLLAHDPEDRPESAAVVGRELKRIAHSGQARGLRTAAWIVASTAVVLSLAAIVGQRGPSYLLAQAGSPLVLFAAPADVNDQFLRSENLASLSLEYGGFRADRLVIELVPSESAGGGDRVATRYDLKPQAGSDSRLLLDVAAQPSWSAVVRDLAILSLNGFVELSFRTDAEAPPLAFGRVRVDDSAPAVSLFMAERAGPGVALNGAGRLHVEAEDAIGGVRSLDLVLDCAGREHRRPLPKTAKHDSSEFRGKSAATVGVLSLFGEAFPGVDDHGPVRIWAEAEDPSGNVTVSKVLEWQHFDLRAPEVRTVSTLLKYDRQGAVVRLELDVPEPQIDVSVRGPGGGRIPVTGFDTLGDRVEFLLESVSGDGTAEPFVDGRYSLRIEDRWRNRSRDFVENWRFVARDPDVSVVPISGRVAPWHDRTLVSDGGTCDLHVTCSDLYRLRTAVVIAAEAEGSTVTAEVEAATEGAVVGYRVAIPRLPDGEHRLTLELVAVDGDAADAGLVVAPTTLLVRAAAPRLRIPALADARFLRQLVDRTVLRHEEDDTVAEGGSWRWSPAEIARYRGTVWSGRPGALEPREVRVETLANSIVHTIALHRGDNSIALDLHDLLGRRLEVFVGDQPAKTCEVGNDARAVPEVLRFHYDPQPFGLFEPVIRVEHGQPIAFVIRSSLPLRDDDHVELQLGRVALAPRVLRRVEADGRGDLRFEFVAPFEAVAAAAGITTASAAEFLALGAFGVDARLRSPAGEFVVRLEMSPTRSSLTPVDWAALSPDVTLPPQLAKIRMVPTLGSSKPYPDPTMSLAALGGNLARSRFRALPELETRDVREVFLQQGELTRAQYAAIAVAGMAAFDRLVDVADATLDPAWRQFAHGADPLESKRLTLGNLIPPAVFAASGARRQSAERAWRRSVDTAPDRPVRGLDFFQAYTVSRLAGLLLAGEPDLFRLPMGVELELAALSPRVGQPVRLHGSRGVTRAGFALASRLGDDAWPPTEAESRSFGDVVEGELGFEFVGLDYGVREWVGDLPYSRGLVDNALLRLLHEWLSDHPRHLQRAREFAALGERSDIPDALGAFFARVGVVRGVALGEPELQDRLERCSAEFEFDESVPGVVWCVNIRRDGRESGAGAAESNDPLAARIGMRLAGGTEFVRRVRER